VSGLIDAIRRDPDDQAAWKAWFEQCYSRLYYALYWKTGGDVQRTQDLAQEALLRFVRYRGYEKTASDRESLAYIIQIGLNLLRGEKAPLPIEEGSLENIQDPGEPIAATEQASDLQHILAGMEPDEERLLRMVLSGRTTSEVANALGISYTAAASRIHRAGIKATEIAASLQKNR